MTSTVENNASKPLLAGSEVNAEANPNSAGYGTFEGRPRFTRKKLFIVGCILMTELCERLTYYSVVANLILYCTSTLDISSTGAARISLIFSGSVFIVPIFGGYLADAFVGKYNTILGCGLIYVIGLFLLPASAVDYKTWFGPHNEISTETRRGFFLTSLVLIAIGTGGIKSNVGPFGAQQVENLGPQAVQSFFNWFYWFINVGAIIAYSGVAAVQQDVGFDVGFLIPLISMIIALVVFVLNKSKYISSPAKGSVLQDTIGVCCATKCKGFNAAREDEGGPYSNEMVNGVIAVLRILPVFLLVIMYWAVYSQMGTTFFLQSERMDIKLGSGNVPVAVLNIFDTIIIIILIPIMQTVVYPFLAKINKSPSHLQRMGIGMIFAAMSVFVAGILEIYRKKDISIIGQKLAGKTFNASSISVLAQIPQFTLIGASEVFTSISGLEFAYSQAPVFMQGVCMGLFLATSGIGSYVAELILVIVDAVTGSQPPDSWFPDEINDGKTEYLFFLLGILMLIDFVIFAIVAYFYKYRKQDNCEISVTV
ncbi:solute carrier family 15 member 4-like [Mytilus californianus]|uniref:solute carrier family 15 member 4-like n=1 Tax=Mytilus californianus TaxID=6549 RepID=UPI0022466763|nr:solute carrier family 15 member 4-like [Mytilus californianus]